MCEKYVFKIDTMVSGMRINNCISYNTLLFAVNLVRIGVTL